MHEMTVSRYLLWRLEEAGLEHMFGVPGDYVLDFMDRVVESRIRLIGNCNELNAGYATDAYARLKGIGAACVTYGVGGLSILNAVAGAYAERSPVVFISGAPRAAQRIAGTHMHHTLTGYQIQLEIFARVTVDSVQLTNPHTAPDEIDRVLVNCLSEHLPVYIELPVDMVDAPCRAPLALDFQHPHGSHEPALEECVREITALIDSARKPVILVGVEVHRFGLGDALLRLVEKSGIPYGTTIDGKSALPEKHPLFMGVYMGALSRDTVKARVEGADGVLSFGAMTTDINTGGFTARLPEQRMVRAHKDRVRVSSHFYDRVWMGDLIEALTAGLGPHRYAVDHPEDPHGAKGAYTVDPSAPLRVVRFYDRLNRFLRPEHLVLAETGDAMFAASELYIGDPEGFISQAYYLSIGYALPATLGVCLAQPGKRVVLLQGDGSFQMTAQELSTLLRQHCNPIIFLLNNDGYVIERLIHDGPYNDIQPWRYHELPAAFGGDALSLEVRSEGELEDALTVAGENPDRLVFVHLHLPPNEGSAALDRLCTALRQLQTADDNRG
jgi:TPP-dependent 2-oxoacid decarboxylase